LDEYIGVLFLIILLQYNNITACNNIYVALYVLLVHHNIIIKSRI